MDLFKEMPWASMEKQSTPAIVEVFKDRQKVESIKMGVGIFSFGRLPECSMQLEHASISRRHAALAYDEDGDLFLVDLGSAHGTYLDNKQIRAHKRMKLTPQSSIKFGASTRSFRLGFAPPKSETAEEWARRKATEAETNKSQNTKTKAHLEQEPTADESSNAKTEDDADEKDSDQKATDVEEDDRYRKAKEEKDAEEKAREKAERKQSRKDGKKAYWKQAKEEQRAAKRRKKIYIPKPKSENERLDGICGQPTW